MPSAVINTFIYNGDGLRIQKQDSGGTIRFVWDGQAYLAEANSSNALLKEYTQEPTPYGGLIAGAPCAANTRPNVSPCSHRASAPSQYRGT